MTIRRRHLDALGIAAAVVYALPTLAYPFASDQGLFFYIGREWLHGALPYRDIYDFKPPGIFALNALAIWIFGETFWGIRVLEILGVVLMGWVVSRAVRRDDEPPRGAWGAATLLIATYHFSHFAYIDTAQTEFGESLALLASYVVAWRSRRVFRGALLSGALVGVAIVFKLTAPLIGSFATLIVAYRALMIDADKSPTLTRVRRAVGAAALHGVGAVSVMALVVGYFAARGGFDDLVDLLVRHLYDYHEHVVVPPDAAGPAFRGAFGQSHTILFLALWAFGLASALRRGAKKAALSACGAMVLFVLSVLTVVLQRRYLIYYWSVTTPFIALCAAHGVSEIARLRPRLAALVPLVVLIIGFPRSGQPPPFDYEGMTKRFYKYVRGDITRWEYLDAFKERRWEEKLAAVINARKRPGDRLVARGYEPNFYVLTGLTCPDRFAIEVPFIMDGLTYKRDEWRAQHENMIWTVRPRFIISFAFKPDDMQLIQSHGYHEVARENERVLFERDE